MRDLVIRGILYAISPQIRKIFDAKAKELISRNGCLDEGVNYIARVTLIVVEEEEDQASVAAVTSRKGGRTEAGATKGTGRSARSATATRDKEASVSAAMMSATVDMTARGGALSAPAPTTSTTTTETQGLAAAHTHILSTASSERDVSTTVATTTTYGQTPRSTAPTDAIARDKKSSETATVAASVQEKSKRPSTTRSRTTPMVSSGGSRGKRAARSRPLLVLQAVPEEERAPYDTCQTQTSTSDGAGKTRRSGLKLHMLNELVRGLERRSQGSYTKDYYLRMLETTILCCRRAQGNDEVTNDHDSGDDTGPDGAEDSGDLRNGGSSSDGRDKNDKDDSHSDRGGEDGTAGKAGCTQKRPECSGGGGAASHGTDDEVIVKIQDHTTISVSDAPASRMSSCSDKLYPGKKGLLLRLNNSDDIGSGVATEPESYGDVKSVLHVAKRRKQAAGSGNVHDPMAPHQSSLDSVSTVSSDRSRNKAVRSVSGGNTEHKTQAAGKRGNKGASKQKGATKSMIALKEDDIRITFEGPRCAERVTIERCFKKIMRTCGCCGDVETIQHYYLYFINFRMCL